MGGMPKKGATSAWWNLQLEVEEAYMHGEVLAGAIVDLSKAFNTLPRVPVFALAVKAGLPAPLITAWSGAVTACQRRCRVRGSVGPPLVSCVGFAE